MATSRDKVRDLMRRTGRRTVQAAEAASVVAGQFDQMSKALLETNPHFEAGLVALREVLAYMESVKAEVEATTGHAVEGAALAGDLAHELAQVATVASNLPELEQINESVIGRYTLPERPTEKMVRQIIASLESDVLETAGAGGVVFELRARRDDD